MIDAITYLIPAKINGGISFNPNLIIGQDEDQRIVTINASKIDTE